MSDDELIPLAPRHEVTRRDLLKLLGGGVAALGAGCLTRAGDEEIVPYVAEPEQRPGTPLRYASVLALDGFATGVIVETRDGRPIKIDGNPVHPANLGGSQPWMQARILDLYDPQRSTTARLDGSVAAWSAVEARLAALPSGPLWLVMPPQSSPTLGALLDRLRARREVHIVFDAPIDHRTAYRGTRIAYGEPLELQLALSRADVVVGLDADFLSSMPMSAAWARTAAARRAPDLRMSRLWVCEPMPTATGSLADERLAIPASDIACVTTCLIDELARRGLEVPRLRGDLIALAWQRLRGAAVRVRELAQDLAEHRRAGAVVVGDRQPPIVHALARWIDHACGNVGGPVSLTKPALLDPLGGDSLASFVAALHAGTVAAAIVIDANPVYSTPRALGLPTALAAAPFSLHVGPYVDQTALACTAHLPLAHELEAWGDARAWDGTLAIGQPLVRPRFAVTSAIELLARLLGDSRDARTLVRSQTTAQLGGRGDFPRAWTAALQAGAVAQTRATPIDAAPRWPSSATAELARALAPAPASIEIALAPSHVRDGRFAANAWLQELPHPVTKQTWGNAALLSRATADRLGIDDEDVVRIETDGGRIDLPALVVAGAAEDSITIEVGYGQVVPRIPIADHIGTDAFLLRTDERWLLRGTARRGRGSRRLGRTQTTMSEHDREVAPAATLARFRAEPDFLAHLRGEQASMLRPHPREGVQWAMSIDTSICTGCSACMVACQAENNIATVGAKEVARGRHMNWLRVDRYVRDDGVVVNEPMPCQHCENAPCEYVCPVMATTHSHDGLNEQVYNRCVGTRFCSNNCPYKVRRFNWFANETRTTRALQFNPDVTVRSRGVMEKCTYCVQRIRRSDHEALVERRAVRAGEVVTACQQACPTGAIQFGQLGEQGTALASMRRDPRRFNVLHDLGTRPRTQYLAKITNPRGRR